MEDKVVSTELLKKLEYKTNYDSFTDFYDTNKSEIYNTIVEIFDEFRKTNKIVLSFSVESTIGGLLWSSDFTFSKDQAFVLKRDILPYFEQNEDYEACAKIIELSKELIS